MTTPEKNELTKIGSDIYAAPLNGFISQIALGVTKLTAINTIQTPAQLSGAVEMLQKAKALAGILDKKVEEICRPLKDEKKRIDEIQREVKERALSIMSPLSEAAGRLEKQILDFQKKAREEEERIRQENARIAREAYEATLAAQQKAAETGKPSPPPPEPMVVYQTPVPVAPKVAGTTKVWKWKITDVNLIPREYMTPDQGMITAAVKGGSREIPGIEIYYEEMIRRS